MSREAHYFRVGAFVLLGVALAVAAVLFVGGGLLFHRPIVVESYFDESVQGVELGAPVKLRGVKLGTVSWIGFVGDVYDVSDAPDPVKAGNRVLVRMEIQESAALGGRNGVRGLDELVERGLRLQITPLGITGVSFIQADYLDPRRYPPEPLHWKPQHLFLPSAPSTIQQISTAADRLMTRIDRLDVEGLLTSVGELAVNVNQAVEEANVAGARQSIGELLVEARETTAELRGAIGAMEPKQVSRELQRTLEQSTATLASMQRLVEQTSGDLTAAVENLRVASESLRDAAATARAYPSYLIFGQPPPRPDEVVDR